MADQSGQPQDEPRRPEPRPFDRFETLAKRLLHVSKDDVREAEARERDKRRTA